MRHFRVALYDTTSGTAEEAIEIARTGFRPIFEAQPGFVRYEVGKLDDGGVVSFSVWETEAEAMHAVEMAHDFVKQSLADRIQLRDEHTGDIAWDDPT
jgi:heme-degrading monooxygenase HmoA